MNAGAGGQGGAGPAAGKGSRRQKIQEDNEKKAEVKCKIDQGEYIVVRVLDDKGVPCTSPAWQKFGRVAIAPPPGSPPEAKPTLLKYVQCLNTCKRIKMLGSGRGALADHVCPVQQNNGVVVVPPSAMNDFNHKLVEFFAGNLLPLSLASAPELHALVRAAISLGARFGNVQPENVIPHPTTMARLTASYADGVRGKLIETLREDLEDGMVSATVDGWTDSQTSRKYLGHTAEYINKEFELEDHVLFTPHVDAESVTGSFIREEINSNLSALSLDPEKVKLHYVTDGGSDIVSAVSESTRTYCMDHCTNLVVKKALNPQLTKLNLYGERGGAIVDGVKNAVNIIKCSRKKQHVDLKKALVKGPENRTKQVQFRSCLPMLRAASRKFSQVKKAAKDLGDNSLEEIKLTDLKDLIAHISALESLATKTDNCFVGANFTNS
ncbi:Transposable element Hobo transposase [Frankliniella fusca]|uniref:Transposable element Hobo transposase n=1 Tax=Frankliniella fusca TaxID=407009 RepID=A0AAE1HEV0_9NEOP|nr:Transposable element Hobo transposase [Frankliniella fusca]